MEHRFSAKLSELLRRPFQDPEGFRVGYAEDAWLEENGTVCLVVGGNLLHETLAKLHIQPDIAT